MAIQMPYRKPASRVEVNLMRNGKIMNVGNINLTDGLTPKEFNLYGIYNATKIETSLEKQITRWVNEDNDISDMKSWTLKMHPDFHSTIGVNRAYGICGLAKENNNQYPFFFDLCTQEWSKLSDIKRSALFLLAKSERSASGTNLSVLLVYNTFISGNLLFIMLPSFRPTDNTISFSLYLPPPLIVPGS